jgi:hypothetical protein
VTSWVIHSEANAEGEVMIRCSTACNILDLHWTEHTTDLTLESLINSEMIIGWKQSYRISSEKTEETA